MSSRPDARATEVLAAGPRSLRENSVLRSAGLWWCRATRRRGTTRRSSIGAAAIATSDGHLARISQPAAVEDTKL